MPISITSFVATKVADALISACGGDVVGASISIGDAQKSLYLVIDSKDRNELIVGIQMAQKQIESIVSVSPAPQPFYSVRVVSVNQGE